MTETKHTPAPWEINYKYGFVFHDMNRICEMALCNGWENDAKLIAAAPDLLAALIACIDTLENACYDEHYSVTNARAAIEKATACGET
jgi:hypothetical protein